MKKFLTTFLLCLLTLYWNQAEAQPSYNAAIPVYFHLSEFKLNRQAHIDAVFDLICSANDNFNRKNGVHVSFYAADIDSSACGGNPGKGINVYIGVCPPCGGGGCTNGTTIKLDGYYQDVFTHELGHALGLGHPLDGPCPPCYAIGDQCINSGGAGAGDADCITDTPPNITGNWMNSGSPASTASTFTPCQKHMIEYSAYCRSGYPNNWPVYNPSDPLSSSADYVVPVQRLDLNYSNYYARVWFDYGNRQCNGVALVPTSVTCIVNTKCGAGTNEAVFNYTFSNLNGSYQIPTCYGISSIIFKYNYPNTAVRTVTISPNFLPNTQYACACSQSGPSGRGRGSAGNNPAEGRILSLVVSDKLNYTNDGYKKGEIYDMNGRLLLEKVITDGQGSMDISSLSSGLYLFKAISNGEIKVIKFWKP